jgi:hypothetical protein
MGNKQGSQENKNKVEENNLTQGYADHTKEEEVRIVTQIEMENRNTERLSRERNESVSENGGNKRGDNKGKQNNESVVVQNQVCGGEKNSEIRNNSMDPEVTQTTTTNTQCKNLDKVIETRRISTRNEKTPSMRGNDDFFTVKGKYGQLSVLHQNVQSISNKVLELDLVLKSSLGNIDVLCFTEHWLKEDYLNEIQIDQYKLVDYFSRKNYEHGGSCIYVKNGIRTRELNYLKDWNEEKESEMSATELADYEAIILSI